MLVLISTWLLTSRPAVPACASPWPRNSGGVGKGMLVSPSSSVASSQGSCITDSVALLQGNLPDAAGV